MNTFYNVKQTLAVSDIKGNITGNIEKWEAHKKGILHKGFSVGILYKDKLLLQNRKHPAFDGMFDFTSSSHQVFKGKKLQSLNEAVLDCLIREWNLQPKSLAYNPEYKGYVYYKAKDPKSVFTEHEICDLLVTEVKEIPTPNFDFSYGYSLVSREELADTNSSIYKNLVPWVKKMIEKKLV
ncbi:MAG: hypothetical protein M1277_00765 [Patescibacteria group bacterium]|nr:hypothetical protein [Patescibacteria group bacterium]